MLDGAPPGAARELLRARLEPLGESARQVLAAAAVIGREFDFEGVRAASGRSDEEVVTALEELVRYGLVHELAGPAASYDFSHEKLRALVYEDTSPARRRLLHRRAADALSTRGRVGPQAALAARHYQLAGRDDEAAQQHRRAAEHAIGLHTDALAHLEAALALGHPDAPELHERIADLRTLVGDYAGALAGYELAATARAGAPLAAVEHKLGAVYQRRGEWRRAEAHLHAALEAAPAAEHALRARIQADLSLAAHRAGRPGEAATIARAALALAEAAGDRLAEAQAHNMLGALARSAGELELARTELERSLAVANELGDPQARIAALNNLALALHAGGEPDREQCAAHGDRHREAALHNNSPRSAPTRPPASQRSGSS